MLDKLNKINPKYKILPINCPDFLEFGSILTDIDFSDMFTIAQDAMDFSGPGYIREVEAFNRLDSFKDLESIFGKIKIQAGICFGNNVLLNGMEYHKSSEIIIAVTDMILMLGSHKDIVDSNWDSSLTKIFYLPKGSAIELYAGTLHLAPTRVNKEPFCSIIVLPSDTNTPLDREESDNKLLFMENKWLICHLDSPAVERGGYIGIQGNNIKINTL